jgi:ABC-type antimicrobial peptide transport system permease subunit
MKTKLILAIIGIAVVAAALVGVSAAQFVGTQNTTNPTLTQTVPPCADSTGAVPPYCINATNGEPYCYSNGTTAGYCWNTTDTVGGYCQSGGCNGYSYGAQTQSQNQNQNGWGMMSQSGNGFGRCR